MRARERAVRDALQSLRAPAEREAEARGWRVVAAAAAQRPAPSVRHRRTRRRALQVALAVALVAAVVSPAGAAVRHWVAERVSPGLSHPRPALSSLSGGGALLVQSREGPWVVGAHGSKRLLGDYAEASWSPHGIFVAATTRRELAALTPDGTVRWALARPGPLRLARWNGPDGYRIAYLEGASLRVVEGNGAGDRLLARGAAPLAPAWKAGPAHVLAFATAAGAVRALGADDRESLFETAPGAVPLSLAWTGGNLLVTRSHGLRLYDAGGRVLWRWTSPPGAQLTAAAARGRRIAAVLRGGGASRLLLLGPGRRPRVLFAGPGRFAAPLWSPHGGWLLLPWPSADQWLFLRPGKRDARPRAVANVAAQFAPGHHGPAPFPQLSGWCCSRSPAGF